MEATGSPNGSASAQVGVTGNVTENNKKGRDSQKIRDNAIQRIKEIWEVEKIEDAFPAGIKPATLGMSAISNIKSIAIRFPNLAEAQALFVKECKDSNGRPVPVSFSHTDRIVKELIKARKENEPSTPNLKANPTNSEAWTGNTSASTTMKATKAPTKSSNVVPVPGLIVPGTGGTAPFSIGNQQMKKTVGDMQSTKTGMPDKDLNPLTSSSAESMKRLQPQNKPLGSSESTIGNRSKTTKESAPLGSSLTGSSIPKKRRLPAKKPDDIGQDKPSPKKIKSNEKENESQRSGFKLPEKVQFENMQGVPQSERENEYLNPCDPLAKVVTDDIQGVSQSKKENEAPNLGVKVSKMVGKDMKLVPQSDKVTTRGALQNQLTAQTSQVVKPDEHDLRSLFEEAPATAVPKPFVDSVWDGTLQTEIAKQMAHNKRENDKMFGTSPLKPSYVSQKSAWAQDVPKDTIVVEHRRPSSDEQAQNATPPLMRKTVQTKSAGAQAVTKDTIMVDHHRASGNERPGSEIPPLAAKILQTKRPRSQSPLKSWTLKSVVDNTNSKVKTSTANVNSADNTTATSTTSAGLGVGDKLKEWASKLPETVRELCGHGGSDMARPDQLEQVNELKKILNNTIDRMEIDIQFVFDKAALARQAGSK